MTEPCMFPNLHEPFYCRIHADVRLRLTDERCRRGVTLTQPQPDAGLREAVLANPGVVFPNLPYQPALPDVLDAVAAWMDGKDDEAALRDQRPNDRGVQKYLRERADALRAALRSTPAAHQPDTRPTGDTCPTCWQPVQGPVRGDHDYGIALSPRPTGDTARWIQGVGYEDEHTPVPQREEPEPDEIHCRHCGADLTETGPAAPKEADRE